MLQALGEQVTYGAASIYAVFEHAYVEVGGVESLHPTLLVRDSDVSGVAHGTSITVGGTAYTVRGIEPDGTGMTTLILEAA